MTLPAEIPADGWLSHGSDTRVGSQWYRHSTMYSWILTYTLILCMDEVRASLHIAVQFWGEGGIQLLYTSFCIRQFLVLADPDGKNTIRKTVLF